MSGAPTPVFIPEAFAINAAVGDRNAIPTAPIDGQHASFDLGFPPLTMTPVVAGGKKMLGPDMNGVLYTLFTHAVYAQAGQLYPYSSAVSTAFSGYAIGALLGSTDGSTVWVNTVNGNTTDPDSGGTVGWLPFRSYGPAAITGLVGGIRTLIPAESAKNLIVLTGTLVANQQIVLPATYQSWIVVNSTTGAFTVTVKTAAQSVGVTVPAGGSASPTMVYGDGTNINAAFVPAALPIDVAATPATIALRDNLGFLYGATASPGDNTTREATTAFVMAAIAAVFPFKVAFARVNSAGTLQAGSFGVTSVTRLGAGSYVVNATAAGFAGGTTPVAVATNRVLIFDTTTISANMTSNTSCSVTAWVENQALQDRDFQILIIGA